MSQGVPSRWTTCTKCGSPHGYPNVGLCAKCRPNGRSKYFWKPYQEEHLRLLYAEHVHNRLELSAAIRTFAASLGFPAYAVKHKATQLGITNDIRRPWTRAELSLLQQYAGAKPISFFKQRLGREYYSISSQLTRLQLSRRVTAGYSRQDVAICLGVSKETVTRWIGHRWLRPSELTDRIPETQLLRFIKEHPEEYRLKRVDEHWFKGLLFPLMGIRLVSKRGKERAA